MTRASPYSCSPGRTSTLCALQKSQEKTLYSSLSSIGQTIRPSHCGLRCPRCAYAVDRRHLLLQSETRSAKLPREPYPCARQGCGEGSVCFGYPTVSDCLVHHLQHAQASGKNEPRMSREACYIHKENYSATCVRTDGFVVRAGDEQVAIGRAPRH